MCLPRSHTEVAIVSRSLEKSVLPKLGILSFSHLGVDFRRLSDTHWCISLSACEAPFVFDSLHFLMAFQYWSYRDQAARVFHNRSVMFHIVSYCFVTSWGMKDINFKCFNEESSAMFDSNDLMRFCVLFWFLCRTCEGLWLLVKPWISSLVEKPAWLAANSANRWSTRTEHNIEIHWIILPKLSVCVLAAVSHFQRWRAIPKIFRHYYQPPPAFI